MDFQVLGPLRAVLDGVEVDVRGAKERTLLGHLVARAGQVVPTSDLIASLWGEDPPRTATKSLQTYVLRLRNALEPDRGAEPRVLVTAGGGYRLAITERDTDAGRFAHLTRLARQSLEAGHAEAALDTARDGLTMWRGPAYAGCEDTTFGPAEARRLGELRLVAEEVRLEAMLALGQEGAAASELERLVAEHPLHERWWELLVLARYRAGQQGPALEAYERARAVLSEELGIDPGPALRRLHASVLAQDPALDRPRPRHVLPAGLRGHGPLVGRDAELEVLREHWGRTCAGATTSVLVRGPSGAGASALAAALAREVAATGHQVLHGDAPAPTSGPWLRVVEGPSHPGEDGSMLLRLAGPGADPGSATVLDLAPLAPDDVRRVVAAYAEPAGAATITQALLDTGPAWPGRVHAEAGRLAREAASRSVAVAVGLAEESSLRLASARADLSSGIETLGTAAGAPAASPSTPECPWRGLAAYDVDDAAWFAGRERLVAELLARLATTRLLAIVGASGSGKSSALRAGVLAALAADVLPGSSGWRQVVMRPGRHPMRELARAALGGTGAEVGEVLARLVRAEGTERTLLVVDQMEEVWTACEDEGERLAFLDTLADLCDDPRTRTQVVLAVRADYVGGAAEHARLATLVNDGTVLVGSPTSAEVERAITRPAARAGLQLEDGLAETVVADAGAEPGLLPLLSVALTQLWERREGDTLTYAGYVGIGGISGAIGTLAEDVWEHLSGEEQVAARRLLLRLAGPGEGAAVVRRRVPLAEVDALGQVGLRGVVDRLAAARLVTVGDAHVEVAHEALFREWPRLSGWLTDDASGRAVQRRLALAAAEWDAEGREATALWRGTRLQSGLDVASARPDEVTHVERAFLEAGRDASAAEEDEVRRRAEATARQNRRLRWLLVGIGVLLALALVAGAVALSARSDAEGSARAATDEARRADARALAADALNEDRPALALLQAVEATERDEGPETFGALLTLLTRNPDVVTRFRVPDRFLRISASPDGGTVWISDNTDVLRAVDTDSAELRWEVASGDGQWGTAVGHPGGRWLAVPMLGDPSAGVLAVLDPGTGAVRRTVTLDDLAAAAPGTVSWVDEAAHLAPGGDRVLLTTGTHVFEIDPLDGRVVAGRRIGAASHSPYSIAMPDGRLAFQVEPADTLLVDPRTGAVQRRPGVVVGVDDDGRVLTTTAAKNSSGAETSTLTLRDAAWRRVGRSWDVPGYVRAALFLPGRRQVAVARDEALLVFDLRTRALLREVDAHSGALLQMTLAGPDRELIWTAGRDGTAVALDTSGTRGLLRRLPTDVRGDSAAVGGGRAVVMNLEETTLNTASVLDLTTGEVVADELQPVTSCNCQPGQVAITPDGRLGLVAIIEYTPTWEPVDDRGRVVVLDTADGRTVRTIRTPWEASGLAMSPDGRHLLVNGTRGWGLWDVTTGERVWVREADDEVRWWPGLPLATFSDDGTVAALARNEDVVLVDPATGEELRRTALTGSMTPGRLLFDADGSTLVAGSWSGRLYFLDARTLERTDPDRLVTAGGVLDAALSPDGRMLAAMGTDGDVTLFDTATWKPYGKPVVDKLGWGFLQFTDRDTLVIRGEFGADHEIDTAPDDWVAAACRAANTAFTPEESALVLPGEPVSPTCA